MGSTALVVAAWLMSLGAAAIEPSPATSSFQPLWMAIHVHSTASTGTMSLESLAERAERQGLDALVLSENFTLRYEYGLRPLEGVLKYSVSLPSVLDYGIERYLAEVRAVRERHPKLIIIPGVEVAPHYYWTGSLTAGDLTLHNAQRNLLVMGLERADDYASLPARGNPSSFVWDSRSAANGWPLLLIAPALWLWAPRRSAATGSDRLPSGRRVSAAALVLLSLMLVAYAWPLASPSFSSYDPETGYRPYQALIDTAVDRGGLVFWSMTEARDFSQHAFGPLGTVAVKTEPHPESLALTERYTGFGGLYQDTRSIIAPGSLWDQVLQARVMNEAAPPVVIGEAAFHGLEDQGKDLDRVYTVVLVTERTPGAIVAALRTGRAWTVARGDEQVLLQLDEFTVTDERSGRAGLAERLQTTDPAPPHIRVGLSAVDGGRHPLRARLIREGTVVGTVEGDTPLQWEVVDQDAPVDRWLPYRVEVTGKSGELLTNPVYVKRQDGRTSG